MTTQTTTPQQREVLHFIEEFVAKNGSAPAVDEIQKALGTLFAGNFDDQLIRLERMGLIRRRVELVDPEKSEGPRTVTDDEFKASVTRIRKAYRETLDRLGQ